MGRYRGGFFRLALLAIMPLASSAAEPVRVTPSVPSPLAKSSELIERQFSPLEAYQLQEKLDSLGIHDILHIDLASEHLQVRRPAKPAADGRYGLLVYLDARPQPRLDMQWANILDSHGIVFVSPENAGDDASALDRRIPLALDAYEYARQAYPLDPDRIYIAGISGGARVAERLAVSYPDVFTAAIVNSGAVELGTQELPAPAMESLQRLRAHSRFLFVTAKLDEPAFKGQRLTVESFHRYCVPIAGVFAPGNLIVGHASIDGLALSDMLDTIELPRGSKEQPDPGCEAALHGEAMEAAAKVKQLAADGRHEDAIKALVAFDHAYGRLYLEQDLALAKSINPALFAHTPAPASAAPSAPLH